MEDYIKKGIKYIFANYVNIHGICMGKVLPIEKINRLETDGIRFAGVQADGIRQRPNEIEVSAYGDFARSLILPWKKNVLWVPCYLRRYNDFHPFCSRVILKKIIDSAKEKYSLEFNIGIEAEFYLLKKDSNNSIVPYNEQEPIIPAYNLDGTLKTMSYWEKILGYMEELDLDIFTLMHEGGKSQLEFSYGFSDPITAADRFTFFRMMAKEIASQMGIIASFMPKPFTNDLGSAAQVNISLKSTHQAKISEKDKLYFIGGILKYAKSIVAVTCPTVNSYKRLIGKGNSPDITWAPTLITYGEDNRTAMLRIVTKDDRIEFRPADSSCNPYLTLAMLIKAGLKGIDEKIEISTNIVDNIYDFTPEMVKEKSIQQLPTTLLEAIDYFKNDTLSYEVMGDLKDDYVSIKMQEWNEFYYQITDWETKTYLYW